MVVRLLRLHQEHHQGMVLVVPLTGPLSHPVEENSLQVVPRVVGTEQHLEQVDSRVLAMEIDQMQVPVLHQASSQSMASLSLLWDMGTRPHEGPGLPQGEAGCHPPTPALSHPRTIPSLDPSTDGHC